MDTLVLLGLGGVAAVAIANRDAVSRTVNVVTNKPTEPPPYTKPSTPTNNPSTPAKPNPSTTKPPITPSPSPAPAKPANPAAPTGALKFVFPTQLNQYKKLLEKSAIGNGVRVSLLSALLLEWNSAPTNQPVDNVLVNLEYIINTYAKTMPNWARHQFARRFGLTGVLGFHTAWLGFRGKPDDLLEPARNIEYAARVLNKFIGKYKANPAMPEFGAGYFAALVAFMDDDIAANQWLKTRASIRGSEFAKRVLIRERAMYKNQF